MLLEELQSLSERGFIAAPCFALIHAGLGETDRALRWLELGCERRDLSLTLLGVHPIYDPLRAEPRMHALLRRMGLEPRCCRAQTMPKHFGDFLEAHGYCPGVFPVKQDTPLAQVIEDLIMLWAASAAGEWRNRIIEIPQ